MQFSGIRSIGINAGQIAAARLLSPVVRAVYVVVLATYLGPEAYGILAYSQSWYLAFLPLSAVGLGAILARDVGRDRGRGGQVVAQVLALRIAATAVAAFLCGFAGWVFEGDPTARILLLIFLFALAGRSLAVAAEHVFIAYESSRYMLQQEAVFRPLDVVAGLTALVLGGGVVAVAAVHAVVWCLQAARGLYIVRRQFVSLRLDWTPRALRRLLVQGLPICFAGVFSTWLVHGPIVLFRHTTESVSDLGQLALVFQAFALLSVIPLSIGGAALPVLSRAVARQDGKDVIFSEGMCRAAFILGAAGGLIGMAAGPWLVDLLFGDRFEQAGQLLGPALWLVIPFAVAGAAGPVLVAKGQFLTPALCALAGALVMTSILPTLAPKIGPSAALFAAGAGMAVWAVSLVIILARTGGLDISRALIRPALAVLPALGVYLGAAPVGAWFALPAALLVLSGGVMGLGVFTREERAGLMAWLRRGRSFLRG